MSSTKTFQKNTVDTTKRITGKLSYGFLLAEVKEDLQNYEWKVFGHTAKGQHFFNRDLYLTSSKGKKKKNQPTQTIQFPASGPLPSPSLKTDAVLTKGPLK